MRVTCGFFCRFIREHDDVALIFPVQPLVQGEGRREENGPPSRPRHPYRAFGLQRLRQSSCPNAWLIVSDSGGIQEEAPTLGKPLLILRENTERPECIDAGVARLVGGRPETLSAMLEEAYQKGSWVESVDKVPNPFGDGRSGQRIAACVAELLGAEALGQDRHRRPMAQASERANAAAV